MIDVMLVLLIIFMIVIPAISAGFKAQPPQGVNLKPHPEEDQDQVLGIDANGQYYLNKKPIKNETLASEAQDDLRRAHGGQDPVRQGRQGSRVRQGHRRTRHRGDTGVRVTGLISDQRPGTMSTVAA